MLIFACIIRLWIPKRGFSSLMCYTSVCCWTHSLMGCVKWFQRQLHIPQLPSSPEMPNGINQGIPWLGIGHTPQHTWCDKPGLFYYRRANLFPLRHLHQNPGLKPFLFYFYLFLFILYLFIFHKSLPGVDLQPLWRAAVFPKAAVPR